MKRLEQFFLKRYTDLDQWEYRRVSLQFYFLVISSIFAVGYFFNTYLTEFLVARYLMVASTIWFSILLLCIRWKLNSLWISQLFILSCWNIVAILSLFSGGIHSYVLPWLVMIPIVALVLSTYRSTWIWVVVCVTSILAFYFFDGTFEIPQKWAAPSDPALTVSLHIGLILIVLWLTYIFEVSQRTFINQIEAQNKELISMDEELRLSLEELSATQELLAEREAESRSIVDALREHFFITEFDAQGNIIYANKKVINMTKSDPVGLNRFQQMDPTMREQQQTNWSSILKGFSRSGESKYDVSGHQFWVMSTYAPIQNRHGKVSKILSVAHEITETKKREKEISEVNIKLEKALNDIKKMNVLLEVRVHERTTELEEKNKYLAEYAFINSHLLRGPLCRLMGLIQLLEYADVSKKDNELLDYLRRAGEELDFVVEKINSAIEKGSYFDRDIISGNLKSI